MEISPELLERLSKILHRVNRRRAWDVPIELLSSLLGIKLQAKIIVELKSISSLLLRIRETRLDYKETLPELGWVAKTILL